MFSKLCTLLFLSIPVFVSGTPDASVEVHRFRSGTNFYAEVSIYIVGSSLTCLPEKTAEYGIDYIILIKNSQKEVVTGNHYKLINSGCPAKDLIDIKRFILLPGIYSVEVEMKDLYDSLNTLTITQTTEIKATDQPGLSDLQLLSIVRTEADGAGPLHKSGLYLEPLPFQYYYPALDKLNLYIESYSTDKLEGQPYLQYTLRPLSGDVPSPLIAHRRVAKQSIAVNVLQLNIQDLISGPYRLKAALFDGNKKPVDSTEITFSRFNPKGDSIFIASGSLNLDASFIKKIPEDSLDYHLKAMAPIVGSIRVDIMNVLLEKGSTKAKQYFIHRYWTEEAGKFADQAFAAYMKVARFVDDNFRSGFGYGFETDRGHIFLKYGAPDEIIPVEDEPSAPPYEIWFYNDFKATHQSNVRFLFYNPTLAKNAYTLLHSTAIGETKNERWEVELYRDATLETPGVNEKVMGDNVHRNARRYFEN